MKTYRLLAAAAALMLALSPAWAKDNTKDPKNPTPAEKRAQLKSDVAAAIDRYKKADPGMDRFFTQSAGYVVFPSIDKAGFIVGGGHGAGEVYEKGKLIGTATITMGTVGLQAGAQTFSQVVFFKDEAALDRFKKNKFEFTANASAVAAKAGASTNADYRSGVAVFTRAEEGVMAEAAIGSQKFKYTAEAGAASTKK
ncbi:MAG TPA: YSC84-related protein [Burkholderiales bacterium]|jgi:lipid-binding SYLF domain-containing protein|nr:YSC84-related protein [Burkholderiales bacterium]